VEAILIGSPNEIAHDHGAAAVIGFEREPATECKGGYDRNPIEGYLEVASRKTVAMNVARYGGLAVECRIHLLPVDVLGIGECGGSKDKTPRKAEKVRACSSSLINHRL
jgi:hypothetical protein